MSQRRIRIRLHGSRLPPGYTISIRLLTSENRHAQPKAPTRKRKRKTGGSSPAQATTPHTSDTDDDDNVPDVHESADPATTSYEKELQEQEDEQVRLTNAYPGAVNDIGSIHQRRWYLSMDRHASGFVPKKRDVNHQGGRKKWMRRWEDGRLLGFEPFFVMGREVERSVATGRAADEVMRDEGVEGFVGRKGWSAVVE